MEGETLSVWTAFSTGPAPERFQSGPFSLDCIFPCLFRSSWTLIASLLDAGFHWTFNCTFRAVPVRFQSVSANCRIKTVPFSSAFSTG